MSRTTDAAEQLARRGALLITLLRRGKSDHQKQILLWGGLKIVASAAIGALALAILSAASPALPRAAGVALACVTWVALAWLVWRHWVRPLRAVPNLAVFSRLVEERRDFKDMLRAALEFSQQGVGTGGSTDLAAATVDRAYDEASKLRLTQLFEFPDRRRDALLAGGAVAALAILTLLSPLAPGRALRGLAFAWPTPGEIQYGQLEAVTRDLTVLAGESATVAARDHGPQAPEMTLRYNDTGDLWKSRALQPQRAEVPREYSFQFENVRDNMTYRFESGGRKTAEHRITVVQRPIVSHLQLRLVPPPYTGRAPALLEEGRGDAVALLGTRIEIGAAASAPLASATLVPEGDAAGLVTQKGPLQMQTAGKTFRAAFMLRSDLRYHFDLVDSLGHTNADPVAYQLSSVEDRAPYVEVRVPGQDADLPQSLQVPLTVYAADDFGISRMTLVYRHERDAENLDKPWVQKKLELRGEGTTNAEGQPLGAGPTPEVLKNLTWSLSDAGLFPGDYVTYYVEVEDNDAFSGHKVARSPSYKLRLKTLSELYAKVQEEDQNRVTKIDDVLEKGKQLQEKYEKMARELKKNPEVDYKKQQEIQSALEKQKQLSEQVQKIAEDLDHEVQKMQEQQLVTQDIAQKMEEIRKLLQDVENDTLKQYMQRLQEAMKQITPEEIQRAMEQMQLSQEEFLKRLDRTKALLQQLQREQKLDSMVEQLSKLLQNQEQVGQNTEKAQKESKSDERNAEQRAADKKQSEQLSKEQKDLADQAKKLQEELKQLAEEAKKAGQDQLDEANKQMQQEDPPSEMSDASEGLKQQQMDSAQQHQQKAEKSLRSLYQQMMAAQQGMSMSAQMEAAAKMQQAARKALDVSFRQEGLSRKATPGGDYDSQGQLAEQQQTLLSATKKIVNDLDALAQKSTKMPPQVSAMLGQAMRDMREGVTSYEKGNSLGGRLQGEQAYGELNRAVIELERSSSSSCKNPGGSGSSNQQMEQLMGQQQELNGMTRQFKDALSQPNRLTPEQRAQMSRLLGEQQSIQSKLEDIQRQAAQQRDLLGHLDKMHEEMREVVENMRSDQVNEETLRLQDRIVSRMLDAQRSLHKRDFNEQRESRTAREDYSRGGKPLQETERIKKLRRDVERALRSGTPEEYDELVRQYFRAIAETEGAPKPPAP